MRPPKFFSAKVIFGLINRTNEKIRIGNLESSRDWGLAKEYIEVFPRMLEHEIGEDFVIGTGRSHKVREFIEVAIKLLRLDGSIEDYFQVDQNLRRPDDTSHLVSNPSKAKTQLNWHPEMDFEKIIQSLITEHESH